MSIYRTEVRTDPRRAELPAKLTRNKDEPLTLPESNRADENRIPSRAPRLASPETPERIRDRTKPSSPEP